MHTIYWQRSYTTFGSFWKNSKMSVSTISPPPLGDHLWNDLTSVKIKSELDLSSVCVKSQHSYFSQPCFANINSEIHNMLILCYPFTYYFHNFLYHD